MLRRIHLRGFKSFATPVDLEFGPGVNVIVGPNGSGKSNLAEAMVWSMGEQRATRLRASGMAEVVFSGGEGRPPAGLAEVRMTVSPAHPARDQPAETEVARRLTRAGDATYQLNGTACRLLDVHEALGALGLGPDALAVIRQGQVEAVCTARPADLRAVVEEAAGVALSRRRRRRAEAKLGRVSERLDRARDLATELTRRQAALERQARAAARAADLDVQIADARRRLATDQAASALRDEFVATGDVTRCSARHRETQEALGEAEAAVRAAESALQGQAAEHDLRRDVARGLHSASERMRGRVDLARERLDDSRRRLDRDVGERAAAAESHGDAVAAAATAADRLEAAGAALDAVREVHGASTERLREAEAALLAVRGATRDARERLDDAMRASVRADARIAELTDAQRQAADRLAALGADVDGADTARAERRVEIASARVARWAARTDDAAAALRDAQAAVATAEQHRRELAATVHALRPAGTPSPDALGTALEVEPGTERAFGAALGALADASAVQSMDDADRVLDAGCVTVLVETGVRPSAAPAPPVGRPLRDLIVGCDARMRIHLERILASVALVDSLESVPPDAHGLFVTVRGDTWRPRQGVRQRATSDWALQAEYRAASVRLDDLDAALAAAQATRAGHQATVASTSSRRRAAERAAARADAALGLARARSARAGLERDEATAAAAAVHDELGELVSDRERMAGEVARNAAEMEATAASEVASAATRDRLRPSVDDAAHALADAQAEVAAATVAAAEAGEYLRIIERRASAPQVAVDLGGAETAVAALEHIASLLGRRADGLAAEVDAGRVHVEAAEGVLADVRGRREAALTAHGQAVEALHRAELGVAAATARAVELVGAHDVSEPDVTEAVDLDEQSRQIDDLERRRRMIGAVNELANSEWEETSDRATEIIEQVADLEAAAAELTVHMQGLDDAVTDGFQQVFDVVGQRFHDAVEVLFPGGQGRLERVDSEDGEPGIEIHVVPAGKRSRPLAMMSGGERSLIALAFCLAIAMTRPAPFYLLDEVEAALDDTNLRRFLALVRRLSDETQFVLITHQQPTVEIADTLFGVTMGADGVSQVVSRRLGDDLAGATRPVVRRQLKAIQGGRA